MRGVGALIVDAFVTVLMAPHEFPSVVFAPSDWPLTVSSLQSLLSEPERWHRVFMAGAVETKSRDTEPAVSGPRRCLREVLEDDSSSLLLCPAAQLALARIAANRTNHVSDCLLSS